MAVARQRPPRAASPIRPTAEILAPLNMGYNGYVDPTLASPNQWVGASNIYSGQFGYLQRARFGPVVQAGKNNFPAQNSYPTSLYNYRIPSPEDSYLLLDSNGKLFSFDSGSSPQYQATQRINAMVDPAGAGSPSLNGPWSRTTLENICYEANGTVLQTGRTANASVIENWGISAPDAQPQLGVTASTTVNITSIARSGGVVTAVLASDLTASLVNINGVADPSYNGTFQVLTGSGGTTLTWDQPGTNSTSSGGTASNGIPPSIQQTANIVAITRSLNVVIAVFSQAVTASQVGISGVTDSSFDGTAFYVVSGSGTNTLTWSQVGTDSVSSGGAVTWNTTVLSVGRSYAWAWENPAKFNVSAPSPVTEYVLYNNQYGTITCVEVGTVSLTSGSAVVTGANGALFSDAWIGLNLWVAGVGNAGRIVSVQSDTQLTLAVAATASATGQQFIPYDPQVGYLRLYMTADGGSDYYRAYRNQFVPAATTVSGAGLVFTDQAQSDAPNFPFTTELAQLYNVPPPVGAFVHPYMNRILLWGVPGEDQSFFYTNNELTTIGIPAESSAPLNFFTLPIRNAKINGMAALPTGVIVWSDLQDMYKITGTLTDNTAATANQQGATVLQLPYQLGCASPFGVQVTPLGAIWLTPTKEMWLYTDQYAPRNIGRPVQDILNSISTAGLANCRMSYYVNLLRNWLILAIPANGATYNNKLLILDLDMLAANGEPSFFVFDMATKHPTFYPYDVACTAITPMLETGEQFRIFAAGLDTVLDIDWNGSTYLSGSEQPVSSFVTLHAWGNDSAQVIKSPGWIRFVTDTAPNEVYASGWSANLYASDDDVYSLASPLTLLLTPGTNDAQTLSGQWTTKVGVSTVGRSYRFGPLLFLFGGVNWVRARRMQIQVNFPVSAGEWRLRQVQIGFDSYPPR